MARIRTLGTDVWMQLTPEGRKRLKTLMFIQEKSQRDVAEAAGWSNSHSFVGRLLRGDVDTLKPDSAARIAHFFGVGMDDLFVPRVSSSTGDSTQSKRSA